MSKILLMPENKQIEAYNKYVDGYIFGLKNYAVNLACFLDLDEIKELPFSDKDIFIAINKNIYTEELEQLEIYLKELDKLPIKGILYADTALVNLKKKLDLKLDLVWSQEHLTTNYETINNWYDFNVLYTYISSDLTLHEIKEIKEKSKAKLIVPIFGYIPIFTSKRHEVKNYLDNFNIKSNSKEYYIEKEDNIYPIVDDKEGTVVYSSHILNGYKEYKELDVDYVTINAFKIKEEDLVEVLKTFKKKKKEDLIFENSDKGFLYKNMIYKI